jgi:Protein of unknown function (DUF3631)
MGPAERGVRRLCFNCFQERGRDAAASVSPDRGATAAEGKDAADPLTADAAEGEGPLPLGDALARIQAFIREYMILSDVQANAVVLWVAHTHALPAAAATPYLAITSAEMESGKTRLLEILRTLVANPWFTGRTTTAALTRKIDKHHPTLLLDESDTAFKGDKEYAEALRGVLNSGYRPGGAVTVCVGQGSGLDVRDFSTFCPKAIAGIGKLPDTVQSRSIPVVLKKRLDSEPVGRAREGAVGAQGGALADALAEALAPHMEALAAAEPDLPEALSDRAQDVWEPLLAIADLAGGGWPEDAREAAVELSSRQAAEATLGVRLLDGIRGVYQQAGDPDELSSAQIVAALNDMEEAPWGGWHDGKGITARELAYKLRLYEITSGDVHVEEAGRRRTLKGYQRADFQDAWERYLPASGESIRAKSANGFVKPKTGTRQERQSTLVARIESPQKPHDNADGADGADESGGPGEKRASAPPHGSGPGLHHLTEDEYVEQWRKRQAQKRQAE